MTTLFNSSDSVSATSFTKIMIEATTITATIRPRPPSLKGRKYKKTLMAKAYRGGEIDAQISMSRRLAVVRSVCVILFVAERDSQIARRLDDVVIARDLFAFADRDRERDGGDV